jgi:hypothetical protein
MKIETGQFSWLKRGENFNKMGVARNSNNAKNGRKMVTEHCPLHFLTEIVFDLCKGTFIASNKLTDRLKRENRSRGGSK